MTPSTRLDEVDSPNTPNFVGGSVGLGVGVGVGMWIGVAALVVPLLQLYDILPRGSSRQGAYVLLAYVVAYSLLNPEPNTKPNPPNFVGGSVGLGVGGSTLSRRSTLSGGWLDWVVVLVLTTLMVTVVVVVDVAPWDLMLVALPIVAGGVERSLLVN